MQPTSQSAPPSKGRLWAGRIISAIPIVMLLFSAVMKFLRPPSVVEGFAHYGYPENMIVGIGILELFYHRLREVQNRQILSGQILTCKFRIRFHEF